MIIRLDKYSSVVFNQNALRALLFRKDNFYCLQILTPSINCEGTFLQLEPHISSKAIQILGLIEFIQFRLIHFFLYFE